MESEQALLEEVSRFDHNALATREPSGPLYELIRSRCPVFKTDARGGFWVVMSHDALRRVAVEPAEFMSGRGTMIPSMGAGRPLLPMESDPPDHARYRELLIPMMSPAVTKSIEPMVRSTARDILQGLLAGGRADLHAGYAKQLPMHVITQLLGVGRRQDFWDWTETLIYGRLEEGSSDRTAEAADGLLGYFDSVLSERRSTGRHGEDMVGQLLDAEHAGTLGPRETLDLCFFLLIAGLDNTAFAIRAAIWHLATHPADRRRLIEDPEVIRRAIEEVLRLYAPVPGLSRTVVAPTDLEGQRLEPGDRVLLAFAAANRDGGVFEDPDTFLVDRRANPHVAFGFGPHRCTGLHLARLEIRVAIEEVLSLIPDFRLEDPEAVRWYPPNELTVVFGDGSHAAGGR